MAIHNEIEFENDICDHLAEHGWLYAEKDAAEYDRKLALFPADVIAWVKETNPDAWETLQQKLGASAEATLLKRLRDCLNQSGTLHVLREGFDVLGLRGSLRMAQFKPAIAMNPDIMKRYEANRLRVIRQVRYSEHNENSIDLVLFLNGIPVATIELKTDFTQSIDNAVEQYKNDRNPHPKGQNPEPLLTFKSGALVHFAVSSSSVKMTTRLNGIETSFLPFDLGDNGGAGNPINPNGYKTAYLWEEVWARDSWLEILGRYIVAEKNEKKEITALIFPRYHQLDATRKLRDAVLAEGAGEKYLIQHSAGSGKTKSIAWSAHFLADLHDAKDSKVFDTVVVISDRNVIDKQLKEDIESFERQKGVVATIEGDQGSKSEELTEAFKSGKKIVVCTIQTFPKAIEKVRELSATKNKKFAVIADEAHSSQTGEAASKLKLVLSADEQKELEDGGDVSTEEILAAEMASRASDDGITYVAFTATPKAKTLELFGRRPDPTQPAGEDNLPAPFHVYSMRQAIDEKFILDVLQNYTSYDLAFRLAGEGKDIDSTEVERSEAVAKLMKWVGEHPHNIAQKVKVVVEHFRNTVAPLLDGKAKAMVVVSSRLEAVLWQQAMKKYIKSQDYGLGTLVAFSGKIDDGKSGFDDPVTETSEQLNPGLRGKDIREVFNSDDYQILVVANKFQTGFDQPLLCGMYVDKKLAGVQAVQTLSRLNRCYHDKEKETTYVLDFRNDPQEILAAFKTYFTTAELSDVTDRNIILDLRTKLDAQEFYDDHEIERVVNIVINPRSRQEELEAAIKPVASRLLKRFNTAKHDHRVAVTAKDDTSAKAAKDTLDVLLLFRADLSTYIRVYNFLSQIFNYENTDFEKRAIFFRYLVKTLDFERGKDSVDLSGIFLSHYKLNDHGQRDLGLSDKDTPKLRPITEAGSGSIHEKDKAILAEIIEHLNNLFGSETTEGDQISFAETLKNKALESKTLQEQAATNSKERFANSPNLHSEIVGAVMDSMDAQSELSTQALNSEVILDGLKALMLNQLGLYEELKKKVSA